MAKPFTWSFSGLKAYETCGYKYQQQNLLKKFPEPPSEQLRWGDFVHKSIERTLKGEAPLPKELELYQKWIDKVNQLPGDLYVEQQYALTKTFEPTSYFAPNVWYRGKGDAVKIAITRAAILDWKTGKVKVDDTQLMLMAQCVFSNFPAVQKVHTAFVWLQEDCTTPMEFTREELAEEWPIILERVTAMNEAVKTNSFQKRPSGLCRQYCSVADCEFYKKGLT